MTEQSSSIKPDTLADGSAKQPPPPAEHVRLALAALALCGASTMSAFVTACFSVGARAAGTRQFTPKSLLEALSPYIAAGWVVERSGAYECAYGLGPRVLRSFSPSKVLEITAALKDRQRVMNPYGDQGLLSQDNLDVTLGLLGANLEWPLTLDRLLSFSDQFEVTARLLQEPLHGAFDREWFNGFSLEQQRRLARLLLER